MTGFVSFLIVFVDCVVCEFSLSIHYLEGENAAKSGRPYLTTRVSGGGFMAVQANVGSNLDPPAGFNYAFTISG
ncbi:MAG: hypothetical protein GQ573_08455 [Gammaproteobacteria bacterium]|nr:hypothetical protein [Gammaproteobacteria bacterium]